MKPCRADALGPTYRRNGGPIALGILHEATHPAGAPSAPLGEWDLSRIHQAAGLPR